VQDIDPVCWPETHKNAPSKNSLIEATAAKGCEEDRGSEGGGGVLVLGLSVGKLGAGGLAGAGAEKELEFACRDCDPGSRNEKKLCDSECL
jgi:hypothetical protein